MYGEGKRLSAAQQEALNVRMTRSRSPVLLRDRVLPVGRATRIYLARRQSRIATSVPVLGLARPLSVRHWGPSSPMPPHHARATRKTRSQRASTEMEANNLVGGAQDSNPFAARILCLTKAVHGIKVAEAGSPGPTPSFPSSARSAEESVHPGGFPLRQIHPTATVAIPIPAVTTPMRPLSRHPTTWRYAMPAQALLGPTQTQTQTKQAHPAAFIWRAKPRGQVAATWPPHR